MPEFRIATWNMDYSWRKASHESAWRWLRDSVNPDVALLQEALPPEDTEDVIWKPDGIDATRPWSSAIASSGPRLAPILRRRGKYGPSEQDLMQTFRGSVIIAAVELPSTRPIVVVSLYGRLDEGYATTTVHRQLSDLNPLLDGSQAKRLIIGGDLNCSTQFGPRYARIHRNLFERLEAYGLVNLTRLTKDSRAPLESCPCAEAPHCGHVQTYKDRRSRVPWQDDYLFAGGDLVRNLASCKVLDAGPSSPWEYSDHRPIIATFKL